MTNEFLKDQLSETLKNYLIVYKEKRHSLEDIKSILTALEDLKIIDEATIKKGVSDRYLGKFSRYLFRKIPEVPFSRIIEILRLLSKEGVLDNESIVSLMEELSEMREKRSERDS